MNRKCGKCQEVKSLELFPKNKLKHLGRGHYCKQCSNEVIILYSRTERGLISQVYNGQRSSSRYRGHDMPTYSKVELSQWIRKQKLFTQLFKNWHNSNYNKDYKPSIDRKDDYKPYTLDNIKLMTWKQNQDKLSQDKKNGKHNKQSKAVLQFNLDGTLIKEHYSIAQASRDLNINPKNIIYCCQQKPKYKTAKGFIWRYK